MLLSAQNGEGEMPCGGERHVCGEVPWRMSLHVVPEVSESHTVHCLLFLFLFLFSFSFCHKCMQRFCQKSCPCPQPYGEFAKLQPSMFSRYMKAYRHATGIQLRESSPPHYTHREGGETGRREKETHSSEECQARREWRALQSCPTEVTMLPCCLFSCPSLPLPFMRIYIRRGGYTTAENT